MGKLALPCLALVTDLQLFGSSQLMLKCVSSAIDAGVNIVQLREKNLPGAPLLELAKKLRELTQGKALFIVNERVDVAVSCKADGVQIGENGLPISVVRAIMGSQALCGRSVHDVNGAMQACNQGADFLVLGTMFPTESHPEEPVFGLSLMGLIRKEVDVPILGIGGISVSNAAEVMTAGADGIAVIRSILLADDPAKVTRNLAASISHELVGKKVLKGLM